MDQVRTNLAVWLRHNTGQDPLSVLVREMAEVHEDTAALFLHAGYLCLLSCQAPEGSPDRLGSREMLERLRVERTGSTDERATALAEALWINS